ncbi:hypothetical protein [Algicola sagamiensis]|uniref:hypothetical protein n=1 Tax=Algicola sagamiensis TaxID=163869 RepID=UPI0012FCA6BA|nr:hypothetical protein [Algicola sagamiensis]
MTRYVGQPIYHRAALSGDFRSDEQVIEEDIIGLGKIELFEPVILAKYFNDELDTLNGLKLTLKTPSGESLTLLDQLDKKITLKDGTVKFRFPNSEQQRKEFSEKLNGIDIRDGFKIVRETREDKVSGVVSIQIMNVLKYECPEKPMIQETTDKLSIEEGEQFYFSPKVATNELSEGKTTYKWSLTKDSGIAVHFKADDDTLKFIAPSVTEDTKVQFELVVENNFGQTSTKTYDVEICN